MTHTDTRLLAKKIIVGIIVTVVPLAIIAAGLWSIQRFGVSHANAGQISLAKGTSGAN